MPKAESKTEAEDRIYLGSALNLIASGTGNNLAISRVLGCDNARLWRLLANYPRVRRVENGSALTTWEMV